MEIQQYVTSLGKTARSASFVLAQATTEQKNSALRHIGSVIRHKRDILTSENEKDLEAGKRKGLTDAMLDRLALTSDRIDLMIEGLEQVASLQDPIGEISEMSYRPSGIQVGKMRVPLGVVGIIYESRPNVTIEAASLCLKSGNAAILRGGSEALHSNQALASCIAEGLELAGLPQSAVQIVDRTDREVVGALVQLNQYVDVIIPRGGKGLIERISSEARIPVIKHLDGICHTYIDDDADFEKSIPIVINAKTHRYGVCNAMETLLVSESRSNEFLPVIAEKLVEIGVEIRGCPQTQEIISCKKATEEDWSTEYLAPVISIKIVKNMESAIAHINHYGSHHTDVILTENYSKAMVFLRAVDSSSVMINASSRFADGFEYGLGAEIGISTDKIHARGPVGLEGLTSKKYIVFGDGQIRQ